MTHIPWDQQRRHFRALRLQLDAEGFTVVRAWHGRHLRLRVHRDGREVTITCGMSPRVPEHAVNVAMQQARRGTLPDGKDRP